MKHAGKCEGDAHLGDARRHLGTVELDGDAQLVEHIGRSAGRTGPAIAVLAHLGPGARGHEAGGGRHVERPSTAAGRATGADDVDHVVLGQLERRCSIQHGVDHARHLGRRLTLAPQAEQKPRQLGVGGLAGQHDRHRVAALVGGQVGAVDQPTQQGRPAAVNEEVAHSSILGGTPLITGHKPRDGARGLPRRPAVCRR